MAGMWSSVFAAVFGNGPQTSVPTPTPLPPVPIPLPTPAPATPKPTFLESRDGTTIVRTSDPAIVNSIGEKWTLIPGFGGQVAVNGIADRSTNSVIRIEYHNHRVYQKVGVGRWYSKAVSRDPWISDKDPNPRVVSIPKATTPTPPPTAPSPPPAVTRTQLLAAVDALQAALTKLRTEVSKLSS